MSASPTSFLDDEFGTITVSKRAGARYLRAKVGTDGRLNVTMPRFTPLSVAKAFIMTQRRELRQLLHEQTPAVRYEHAQTIGKSHRIAIVETGLVKQPSVELKGQHIIAKIPPNTEVASEVVQRLLRDAVIKALRVEAKAHLPRRLKELAARHGFRYETVRFSHAGSRWGSCSSRGTISLNIALMKLPDELIDYVLAHELAHTRHMNHSDAFWREVAALDPAYSLHRRQLKLQTPTI